ncbi:hypothetical protein, partial [Hoylesella marshii]|uniref:hypothetical protein n=1 Tax=Hoylesella marshii TaxID=189722 RepID=UPI001EE364B8
FEIRESHPITPKGRQKTKLNPLSPCGIHLSAHACQGWRSYELHTLLKVLRPVGAYRSIAFIQNSCIPLQTVADWGLNKIKYRSKVVDSTFIIIFAPYYLNHYSYENLTH